MPASKSQLTSAANITWVGGDLFNGLVLLIAAMPSTGGAVWTRAALRDTRPKLRVPLRVVVPIREGVLDSNTRVWKTTSLVPPNIKYSAWFYDETNRLISIGATLFSITTDPYVMTIPTLTAPTAAVVSTNPEDVVSTDITTIRYNVPTRENVAGTKDGVNATFTISSTGSLFFLVWNQLVLVETVHYTVSGTTITMLGANLPASDDTFQAVIF
jgi:hypothetical protein